MSPFGIQIQSSPLAWHSPCTHPHKNSTNPVNDHARHNDTSNRLRSLLFLIPSLKPVKNGTSAFTFQKPVMCIYAAIVPATLTSASIGVMFDLKNSVMELTREKDTYMGSEIFALRPAF